MTEELFRSDSYLQTCRAKVIKQTENAVILNQTVFYPMGGGQPGDSGTLICSDGREIKILDCRKDRETGEHLHLFAPEAPLPALGEEVTLQIDWAKRYRLMRMHTALHVLCSLVDGAVTGGQIGEDKSRLDFDMPDAPDKEALEQKINSIIQSAKDVVIGAISDAELEANPDLVRTMSVQPPKGAGSVRTIKIDGIDYQPCGGTHVKNIGEIGLIQIGKVEKKGKLNRRIYLHLAE